MRWPAAVLLAAACAAGCRSTPSTFDPFLPNRRIPPPGTGAASGAPDASYTSPAPPYNGGAPVYPAPAYQTPNYQAPPGGAPATGPFAPTPAPANGGFGVPGPVPSAQISPPASQTPRMAQAGYVTTADDEPSAVYQRRGVSRVAASEVASGSARPSPARPSFAGPSSAGSSSQSIDIMDLPPVLASR